MSDDESGEWVVKQKVIQHSLPRSIDVNHSAAHLTGACPACPVAPGDGTGVAPADGTGVNDVPHYLRRRRKYAKA